MTLTGNETVATVFNVYEWDAIDWDDPDDNDGNYAHCKRHGVTETVVSDVLREQPVEITLSPTWSTSRSPGPTTAGRRYGPCSSTARRSAVTGFGQ
jgi:hypothetical protein